MSVVDIYVAYKFVKILTQPWKDTDAFKLGIIDEKGKILKKRRNLKTGEEKAAYTIFHTLIWNVKKLLDKLPPTRTRLGSFAVALWLLKEYTDPRLEDKTLLERTLVEYLVESGRVSRSEAMDYYFEAMLTEQERELSKGDKADFKPLETSILRKGRFKLLNTVDAPEGSGKKGNIVQARSDIEAFDTLLGQPMFRVKLEKNLKDLVVSFEDLERIAS
jgi:hypothetical protein